MASPGRQSPEAPDDDTRWRSAGDRIQTLLDASAGSGTVVRERTEQLAAELTDLYGAALDRIVAITAECDPELVGRFAADELVASLMLVHGLHPHGVERRIEDALDGVRPYLGSHGGDVTLLAVDDSDDGPVVRLQFAGSCKSCPSSAVTLEFAVEDAVRAAAPEITSIEVVAAESDDPAPTVIPADALMSRVRSGEHAAAWHPAPDVADLGPGEVGGFLVAGVPILACRIGDDLFAYRDRCGRCEESMAGAALHRPMGAPIGAAVLRCPRCGAHFDAVHAGAGLDGASEGTPHLDPIPLLLRNGVLSVAVLAEATGGDVMAGPYDVLARIRANTRPAQPPGERCEMCAEPIGDEHQHVVNVAARQLMCTCRGCYLLFSDPHAKLRYRAVPDRYLTFSDFTLDRRAWEALQIPVGLAFFFRNSNMDKTVAFYPGPAGATESELDLDAWTTISGADSRLDMLADDVEALLVRVPDRDHADPELNAPAECYLVPIDACYEFVGRLRLLWRGFDGGHEVRQFVDEFFEQIRARSKVTSG